MSVVERVERSRLSEFYQHVAPLRLSIKFKVCC